MKPDISLDLAQKQLRIAIPGDLISTSVRALHQEIDAALMVPAGAAAPWQTITLNLASAKMVDSMGLNLIVKILKTAQNAGARLQIIYQNPNVHRTLVFTRLDRYADLIKG